MPKGLQWYWKGDFVTSLPDEANRDAYCAGGQIAERTVADAISTPIDGAAQRVRKKGDRVECAALPPGPW